MTPPAGSPVTIVPGQNPRPMPRPGKAIAPEPEPQEGEVIAFLGKRALTYGDFVKWLKLMAGPRADMVRKNPPSRTQALKQYLELEVLAAKGRRDKLQNTREYKAYLAAVELQCYAKVLQDEDRAGSPARKMKDEAENPSEEEVQAYFKAHLDHYATPETVTARQIVVTSKGPGPKEEEAKARIAKLQEELKAGGKLEDLAKTYSDDPLSKDKGGLYSEVPYGRFPKEVEEAARKQELGQVSEPIKTVNGYCLIQVLARKPKEIPALEKVRDAVLRQMAPERLAKLKEAFLEKTRKEVGYRDVAPAPPQPGKP
jgi:hypothetical protein